MKYYENATYCYQQFQVSRIWLKHNSTQKLLQYEAEILHETYLVQVLSRYYINYKNTLIIIVTVL